jgi:hypothetical protein
MVSQPKGKIFDPNSWILIHEIYLEPHAPIERCIPTVQR